MQELVHFDGPWSSQEKAVVERVVRRVENRLTVPVPDGLLGRPWICARHDSEDGSPQFIARRVYFGDAFEAATVDELVEELNLYVNGR